jgi:hypothetical protein
MHHLLYADLLACASCEALQSLLLVGFWLGCQQSFWLKWLDVACCQYVASVHTSDGKAGCMHAGGMAQWVSRTRARPDVCSSCGLWRLGCQHSCSDGGAVLLLPHPGKVLVVALVLVYCS